MKLKNKNFTAFSLAEVLLTLVITGVIAAMVIPAIINDSDDMVTQTQLKEAYGLFNNALKKATYDNGNVPYKCNYYTDGALQSYVCVYDPDLVKYTCTLPDGTTPEPSNNRSVSNDCTALYASLKNNFSIIKTCAAGQGISQGCMPVYKSLEEVTRLNNSMVTDASVDKTVAGCSAWSASRFTTSINSFVLNNGMIIFYGSSQFPAVDINGIKGPNKWGYDVFTMSLFGTHESNGALKFVADLRCISPEPGGQQPINLLK
jgi:type II secretory pathway pseudopilin PulG